MVLYDAFISYSHAKDKPIAATLQTVIQKLGKPWYRRRALRVFRDDTSLSATPSLWPAIEQALSQSHFLVLLASPEAAASHWVDREVCYWLANKSAQTLLIVVTEGELAWDASQNDFLWDNKNPLPPSLKGRFAHEPKWVDVRAYRQGAGQRDHRFAELAADVAAVLHGIPKEDLLSQEVRQQRRALRLAWSAVGVVLSLLFGVGVLWLEGDRARRLAQTQRDRAEQNFSIAKTSADALVRDLANGLLTLTAIEAPPQTRQQVRVRTQSLLSLAQSMLDQLTTAAPDDLALQASRSTMLRNFAVIYLQTGDQERALTAAEQSLGYARALVGKSHGGKATAESQLMDSLIALGAVELARQDRNGAREAYAEAVELARRMLAKNQNPPLQLSLSFTLEKLSDVSEPNEARPLLIEALKLLIAASNGRPLAPVAVERAQSMRERLAKLPPDSAPRPSADGTGRAGN
jgi:tetratricopeptide (TPR) repeat protein